MSVVRYDQGTWPEKAEITPEGFLRVDAPITRMGVLPYGKNPDGTTRGELRHPEDWSTPQAMASFASLPLTNGHPGGLTPLLDSLNAKEHAIGWTGENVRADGAFLRAPMTIFDASTVLAVQRGKRGTSTGVKVDLKDEEGNYEGVAYQYRQTNPRGNHIAIVDSPRAGTMIRLDDGGNQIVEEEGETNMVKVTLDGISYDAAPEVANALSKAQLAATELKATLDGTSAKSRDEVEKVKAERDTYKERLDELEKRDIRSDVRARVTLETSAREMLPKTEHAKLDDMSDAEIKRACVAASYPHLKLDDKDEVYVAHRFQFALEERGAKQNDDRQHDDAIAKQRQVATTRQDSSGDALTEAARRAQERINNQWKPKAA